MASSPPDHTSSTPTLRTTIPRHHGHHLRASADLSAFHSPLAGRGNRPNSEIFLSQTPKKNNNAESEQLDEWERELQHYEATLEEMASASLDMKEELGAVEQWFRVLTEAERTAALYSLLQQATQVQIRFFLTVLQQMASKTPVNHLLSPASFEKDAMQQKLNSAMSQLSFDNTPRRTNSNPPVSPSPRNSRHLDPSTIQAMFPDAAAALAHQRSLLTSNRNSINGGLPTTTLTSATAPRSPGLHAAKDAWPITSNETPVATKIRPRSADLSNWQGTSTPSQIKSPRVQPQNTPSISEDLASPFGIPGGGSWASMVNTPVVPMFQNPHTTSQRGDTDLGNATAMKLAAWSANNRSSVSGGIINLDSDVRKFRRGRTQQSQQSHPDTLSTPTHSNHGMSGRGGSPTNIVMYDEHGHLVQFTPQMASQMRNVPLAARQTSPRPTSPYPPGFAQFQSIGLTSPVGMGMQQPYLNPYDTSPIIPPSEFGQQGYLSDHTSDRRGGSPLGFGARSKYSHHQINNGARRSSSATKQQEDPLDPSLINDIPAWLRSLRLHKYTDNLSDIKGGVTALAQLSEQDLERRGVSAVGARRKLLKCFEQVRSGLTVDGEGI